MVFQKKYTVRQLKKRVDEYFATTPQEEQSVTGLALALDTSRQSLCNWEKDRELGPVVALAKDQNRACLRDARHEASERIRYLPAQEHGVEGPVRDRHPSFRRYGFLDGAKGVWAGERVK